MLKNTQKYRNGTGVHFTMVCTMFLYQKFLLINEEKCSVPFLYYVDKC
nr:MAG TPA: hypothetical protein [Caudoviricetes sp.]